MKINGHTITAQEFGYDDCHKIYLINSSDDREALVNLSYNILPISMLKETWNMACSLRFIESGDLKRTYVHQGKRAYITGLAA